MCLWLLQLIQFAVPVETQSPLLSSVWNPSLQSQVPESVLQCLLAAVHSLSPVQGVGMTLGMSK